jgi:hypothetical protein
MTAPFAVEFIQNLVVGQFAVEAAEFIRMLSGRRHLVRRLTDKLAATASN